MKLKERFSAAWKVLTTTSSETKSNPLEAHYDSLEAMYLNAGVYDALALLAREGTEEKKNLDNLRALRNPAHRVVEFYAAKLAVHRWHERIEFGEKAKAKADALTKAISRVMWWSNWQAEGRVSVRQYSWAGDFFPKVSSREDSEGNATAVYVERIDPRHVTDFDKDERGHFVFLRVDTPKSRRLANGEMKDYTQTEVWSKETRVYSVYEHERGADESVEKLGEPVEQVVLSEDAVPEEEGGYTGYDFIPVVHIKFRDVGAERGLSAFGHAIGSIKEADRIATKLHEMLFPEILWVLRRQGVGPDGEPLAPLEMPQTGTAAATNFNGLRRSAYKEAQDGIVEIAGEKVASLPTGGELDPKIPDRNFGAHADALAEQVKEVERQLPEATLDRLKELQLSGAAIRNSLFEVYDRYEEAFGNFASGMARIDQMALTIGQSLGLEGFSEAEIGTYGENGEEWEHTFVSEDPFPTSRQDELEAERAEAAVLDLYAELHPELLAKALEGMGYSEEEAERIAGEVVDKRSPPQMRVPSVSSLSLEPGTPTE